MTRPSFRYLASGVIVLWVLTAIAVCFFIPTWPERGQFGDLFGSINALFSGLAFAGLFWSLQVQREQLDLQRVELSLQREELRLQRDEMAASRNELANQVKAQQDLFRASTAHISVAALQAEIEAIKMASESKTPGARSEFVEDIKNVSQVLSELARFVETGERPTP